MAVLLEIDWDFFIYNRAEAGKKLITVEPPGEKKHEVSVWMLYDWGHSEKYGPALANIVWLSRYAAFRNYGIDPLEELAISRPSPSLFAQTLEIRWPRLSDARLWTSDSHAFGLQVAQLSRGPYARPLDRIIHFDAHHDLGYGGGDASDEGDVGAWKKSGTVECGSWLYAVLDAGIAKAVDVVYPDWRGTERPPGAWIKPFSRRIRYMKWSEWRDSKTKYSDVRDIHLCRSSAWTPPWHDGAFEALIGALPWSGRTCLDCLPGGQRIGGFDSCKQRDWGAGAAEELAYPMRKDMVAK